MNRYEFVFLLADEGESKNLKEIISSTSGKLLEEKKWGKKTLAYPIKKNTSAIFFDWLLEIDGQALTELKKKLNFSDKIIRYLLLKVEN